MINVLQRFKRLVLRALEGAVIFLIAALVLDVLWQIATRFLLGNPSSWTVELARYLMIWLAMIGAAVAYAHRQHLGLDFLKQKLHPEAQRAMDVIGELVVIAFAAWVMLGGGTQLVMEVLASGQFTAALGLPMGAVYLATPIAGTAIVVFAIANLSEMLVRSRAPRP